jgi:hypothetical protein
MISVFLCMQTVKRKLSIPAILFVPDRAHESVLSDGALGKKSCRPHDVVIAIVM